MALLELGINILVPVLYPIVPMFGILPALLPCTYQHYKK